MYELEDVCQEGQEKEEFTIDSDLRADWALKIIHKEQADNDRLVKTIEEEIEILELKKKRIKDSLENKIGFLKGKLHEYFNNGGIKPRELKTCYKYNLPSGELVLNKATIKYERNDEKVIQWLTDNNKMEFIKVKPSVDWAELKKTDFIDEIDGITRLEVPMNFEVK